MSERQLFRMPYALLPIVVVGFFISLPVGAAPNHIVINEIQVGGAVAADEFVELFNPTSMAMNLNGWRLSKRTASGNQTNLLTVFPDVSLPAGGYFLITHPTSYTGATAADARYSTSESLAANNTVVLFSDAGSTIVDLAGLGTASSSEGATAPNPPSGQSIERQIGADGVIDTDNNVGDFAVTTAPTPMNLASQAPATPPPNPTPPAPNDNAEATLSNPEATPPPPPSGAGEGGSSGSSLILPGDILINEFISDPTDEDEEWIELINRTGRVIDLSGWIIEDGAEHQTILSGSIAGATPNNFFVVAKPKGNLNNAGDGIILKTPDGQIISEVSYGNWADGNLADNASAASDPASAARTIDGLSSGNAAADFAITLTPTRGLPNIITTAGSTTPSGPATLRLSELFPNPKGSDADEFIEVTNIGISEVSIIGWRVADASGADYTVKEKDFAGPIILPGAYLVLPRKVTGIALNNTGGETIHLFPPNSNSPVHEVNYKDNSPEDASWINLSDQWKWTTTVTPGTANTLAVLNRPPIISLDAPKTAFANENIFFSAEDSTDPDGDTLTFQWNFDDGQTAGGETAAHAYTKAGRYHVTLTADDAHGGKDSRKQTVTIETALTPQVLGISTAAAETVGSASIITNEIFPAPKKGEEEWIELYNQGNEAVSLAGWSLKDASGRAYTIAEDLTILPQGYLTFKKSQTRLALNNAGDNVSLLNPLDEIVDETSYPAAKTGASWARDENGEWDWTSTPTHLADNLFSAADENGGTKATTASSTKTPRGQIAISGMVTAAPGMIGERVIYLANIDSAGVPSNLRIDLSQKTNQAIKLNDIIAVNGNIRQVQGEPRMRVEDVDSVTIIGHEQAELKPTPLAVVDIETDLGRLVVAEGTVTKKTSGGFIMELRDGETIRAVLPTSSKKFPYPPDTEVTIIGLLSRTSAGARLLLRTVQDLTVTAAPLANETMSANAPAPILSSYLTITILGSLVLTAALFYRFRKKLSQPSLASADVFDEEEMV